MVKVTQKYAKPFVKWAGGKSKLAPIIDELVDREINLNKFDTYVEPFIGGGAMFFYLTSKYQFKRVIVSDINIELINTYKAIQGNVERLMNCLDELQREYMSLDDLEAKKEYFYQIREAFNRKIIEKRNDKEISYLKASYFIFLNKSCFNGLYRVNQKGLFNVPFGQKVNLNLYDKENLLSVHEVLQRVEIYVQDYQSTIKYANESTFFYFDPPYRPLTITSFTAYSKSGFNDEDQKELAQHCYAIKEKGASFSLSNSDPHNEDAEDMFFDELYKDFTLHRIHANRAIGAKSNSRGKVSEIVVIG